MSQLKYFTKGGGSKSPSAGLLLALLTPVSRHARERSDDPQLRFRSHSPASNRLPLLAGLESVELGEKASHAVRMAGHHTAPHDGLGRGLRCSLNLRPDHVLKVGVDRTSSHNGKDWENASAAHDF